MIVPIKEAIDSRLVQHQWVYYRCKVIRHVGHVDNTGPQVHLVIVEWDLVQELWLQLLCVEEVCFQVDSRAIVRLWVFCLIQIHLIVAFREETEHLIYCKPEALIIPIASTLVLKVNLVCLVSIDRDSSSVKVVVSLPPDVLEGHYRYICQY